MTALVDAVKIKTGKIKKRKENQIEVEIQTSLTITNRHNMENIWKQDKESITKIKSEESEPPAKTMTITFKITRNPLKPKVNLHKLLKLKHSEKDFNTPKNESKDSNK